MKPKKPVDDSARRRLALNLRAARERLGISQDELAAIAGVHRTFIGSVEREERNITLANLERLAAGVKMDVAELLRKA